MLARKAASRRTTIIIGMTANKYYHGDLMLRAYLLVLALTGNWGRQGTGSSDVVDGRVRWAIHVRHEAAATAWRDARRSSR